MSIWVSILNQGSMKYELYSYIEHDNVIEQQMPGIHKQSDRYTSTVMTLNSKNIFFIRSINRYRWVYFLTRVLSDTCLDRYVYVPYTVAALMTKIVNIPLLLNCSCLSYITCFIKSTMSLRNFLSGILKHCI